MAEYHEPYDVLPQETLDLHRAVKSLMEELEAVDWYQQRISASKNESLKAVLAHNRDEEIEHAAMLLEWLRRSAPGWDERLRVYLFTEKPILELEELAEKRGQRASHGSGRRQPEEGGLIWIS